MKKFFRLAALLFACALLLAGCAASSAASDELQRLAQLEVYSADGQLLRTVTDTDTLIQFNRLVANEIAAQTEPLAESSQTLVDSAAPLYTLAVYKTPASRYPNGQLQKEMELYFASDQPVVRVQIEPSVVKGFPVSKEHLAFYASLSDQSLDFLRSLTEK